MKVALFCHSLLSCWNHGNVHFLRGIVSELRARGHQVVVLEPEDGWSARNLIAEVGTLPIEELEATYPLLGLSEGTVIRYGRAPFDVSEVLDGVDLVLVHEWNEPEVVAALGRERRRRRFTLLFHDTHHRSVTAPHELDRLDLSDYDGILAFGEAVRERWERRGWGRRAHTWHEAADVRVFRPRRAPSRAGDVVWIGNWGDDERAAELRRFLIEPVRALELEAAVHGVRYPESAREELARAGIPVKGWLPNHRVPEVFARYLATVHVPRGPYAAALPGIPTIRVFEALACGIPLVCAPWDDAEGLFHPGQDYLVARDGEEMKRHLAAVVHDADLRASLIASGRHTILSRHTCAHRVDELLAIVAGIRGDTARAERQVRGSLATEVA